MNRVLAWEGATPPLPPANPRATRREAQAPPRRLSAAPPEAAIRALDLVIRRRVEGLLAGDHRTSLTGQGTELASVRPYEAGDDVRQIEWNVTARTGEPHVRLQVAERALTTWLLLDVSPSMNFGTAAQLKADTAEGVALAVGYLATRRGNRLGVATFGGATPAVLPPRQGRSGLHGLLTMLRREPEEDGTPGAALGDALNRASAIARHRGLVVAVSDFRGPGEWGPPLLQLAGRHAVFTVEVTDRREQELPDIGHLELVDPETGRLLRVDTTDRRLRERFADAAREERERLAATFRRAGVEHARLTTDGDWLRQLAGFLRRRGARP